MKHVWNEWRIHLLIQNKEQWQWNSSTHCLNACIPSIFCTATECKLAFPIEENIFPTEPINASTYSLNRRSFIDDAYIYSTHYLWLTLTARASEGVSACSLALTRPYQDRLLHLSPFPSFSVLSLRFLFLSSPSVCQQMPKGRSERCFPEEKGISISEGKY